MSAIYDNWERLFAAVLKKQQIWELCHDHSRSPSILSEASGFSLSFSSKPPLDDLAVDFARLGGSSWSQRGYPKLVLASNFSPAIDAEYLYLASSELLGTGTFGTTYAAAVDSGVRIVVKRLRLMSVSELDFRRHMDIVGDVRHENVVALRAYYSSGNERLVLYDYYHRGSVHAFLHGQYHKLQPYVDWERRLKITIGAARGIVEIHRENDGKLVHGNIKASNVFLNHDHYGCVSEFGLRNLIPTISMSAAHYYAPEVKNAQDVSQASDVYSFGVLLLELLTKMSPEHVTGGPEAVNLVKLVSSIKNRIWDANVFDVELMMHPTIKKQIVKMLHIGMRCVEKSAIKRPKMSEVAMLLEEITTLTSTSQITPVDGTFVFFEDFKPTFDRGEVLGDSAAVLGQGTFGTTYKTTFEDGSSIVVRRLKDVISTYEEFQQHMAITGRMRHQNIDTLRGYYFLRGETLLLYDYHDQDNVSVLLHGTLTGRGKKLLDWETRLKIAVGAAKGISHIHLQDNQNFVHGNIKLSNIFLTRQKYGIISDVGLGKVSRPVTRPVMLTPGYCAPEVKDTGNVSQASDVYSFGVLLLELLSGKPSQFTGYDGKAISLVEWTRSVVESDDPEVWMTNMLDVELVRHGYEETMVQILETAMDCVNIVTERRPNMSHVVMVLEEISAIESESWFEGTCKQPLESRLEKLLEDLLPTLRA